MPDKSPIAMPKTLIFKSPIIPDTKQHPMLTEIIDISLPSEKRSPRKDTENIITSIGAVYISTTAVEIEVICIARK